MWNDCTLLCIYYMYRNIQKIFGGVSWSYGSWIYYLCNQCLSSLKLGVRTPFMARCNQYNIMWSSLSVTYDRSVFSLGTPVSSTYKTDSHDIAVILLKVALNTITLTHLISQFFKKNIWGQFLFDCYQKNCINKIKNLWTFL